MLIPKTKLKKSEIHGFGIFADEFIAKGTIIWDYKEGFDLTINDENFSMLPENTQEFLLYYGFYNKKDGGYILCSDNARFTNHSRNPNCIMPEGEIYITASRDIEIGEEITENYYSYDEKTEQKFKQNNTK